MSLRAVARWFVTALRAAVTAVHVVLAFSRYGVDC